jgi:predicted TIM-barrel fold metal-dependent hydrolase
MDAPPDAAHLLQVIDQLGSDELLMFSTDYPHWHFSPDDPHQAVPAGLPEGTRRKILSENARDFYRL